MLYKSSKEANFITFEKFKTSQSYDDLHIITPKMFIILLIRMPISNLLRLNIAIS